MELGLEGKVAIVTGGSKGIGKATALSLAQEGVNVAICARGVGDLEEAAAAISVRSPMRKPCRWSNGAVGNFSRWAIFRVPKILMGAVGGRKPAAR
mgnify:CR=1 FL=1